MAVTDHKIYLASKSPRRRELLRQIGDTTTVEARGFKIASGRRNVALLWHYARVQPLPLRLRG